MNCCRKVERIDIIADELIVSAQGQLTAMKAAQDAASQSCECAKESQLSAQQAAADAEAARVSACKAEDSATAAAACEANACACADRSCQCADDAAASADKALAAANAAPYINSTTGTWMVWDNATAAFKDTGVVAKGIDGTDGKSPSINTGGTWEVFNDMTQAWEDTGIQAQGPAGKDGTSITIAGSFSDPSELPATAPGGDVWINRNTGHGWMYDPVAGWHDVGPLQGPSGTVALGTVTTGAPGTPVQITNTGTPTAGVFNFAIPQGAKGDTGLPGINAGVNYIINGDFQIWQRGYQHATNGYGSADRWALEYTSGHSCIMKWGGDAIPYLSSITAFGDNLPCLAILPNAAVGTPGYIRFYQRVEGALKFSNQAVTLSFWPYIIQSGDTGASIAVSLGINSPSKNFGINIPGQLIKPYPLQKAVCTFQIPDLTPHLTPYDINVGDDSFLSFYVWLYADSTYDVLTGGLSSMQIVGPNYGVGFTQFKLEAGNEATPFMPRLRGEELVLCQRYFQARHVKAFAPVGITRIGGWDSNPAELRAIPAMSVTAGWPPTGSMFMTPVQAGVRHEHQVSASYDPSYEIDFTLDAEL